MLGFSVKLFVFLFMQVVQFFSTLDPAFWEVLKIFAGSIGWIGGLVLFMWWKEKRRNTSFQLIERNRK
jgi:hypothetical protein